MHPLVSSLTKGIVYPTLEDGPSVYRERSAPWHRHWAFGPVSTINTPSSVEAGDGTSFRNVVNADTIVTLLTELSDIVDDIKPPQRVTVAIISMYKQQVKVLQERTKGLQLSPFLKLDEVQTVDSFQGQEADHVIVDTVRTEGRGFLGQVERINVAITRARRALHIVGSLNVLQRLRSPL